jgi:hypothetical protein
MKRTSALIVSLAILAASCSGDDDGNDTTSVSTTPVTTSAATDPPVTVSTTMVATTATTPQPTTTSGSTTAAPTTTPPTTISTDQTDWASVVQTLGQRRQDLYAAPDVSRIREVCAEDSPCAEQLDVQLADLSNKGWHVVDADRYTVVSAELEDFDGDSLETALVVTVVVVVQRPATGGSIVDSSGAVVAGIDPETEEGVNTENRTTLGRSGLPEDPWRIISQERIREVPG